MQCQWAKRYVVQFLLLKWRHYDFSVWMKKLFYEKFDLCQYVIDNQANSIGIALPQLLDI